MEKSSIHFSPIEQLKRIAEKGLPALHGKNPIFKSPQHLPTAINLTENRQILDNVENPVTFYTKCECWALTVFRNVWPRSLSASPYKKYIII